MTREEAIEMLKSKMDGHTDTSYEWAETVRMAIKALEQEPCDDAVSRDAVLDLVADYDLSMGQVVKGIHALPPVAPQPKMGHWIKDKCSICGEDRAWYGQNPPYCPDCGSYNGGTE